MNHESTGTQKLAIIVGVDCRGLLLCTGTGSEKICAQNGPTHDFSLPSCP
jgi:hypothetical protein